VIADPAVIVPALSLLINGAEVKHVTVAFTVCAAHLDVVAVPVFNSATTYTFCPAVKERFEKVKAPAEVAVVVCFFIPSTYRYKVALASVVPVTEVVALVNALFAGDVMVGTARAPARDPLPLPEEHT